MARVKRGEIEAIHVKNGRKKGLRLKLKCLQPTSSNNAHEQYIAGHALPFSRQARGSASSTASFKASISSKTQKMPGPQAQVLRTNPFPQTN